MVKMLSERQNGSPTKHEAVVSVVIPAYNISRFVSEAIESVLAQTFTGYEIIVINDGSPDTDELERTLAPYLDRIVYLKQQNKGAGAARNAGLLAARGKYVAFLDGDDIWYPTHLSEQISLIESGPGYDLVYADAVNFGDPRLSGRRSMETNPSKGEADFESILGGRCNVITSAVVARREPIIEVGMFDETIVNSQDFDLWLRLARRKGARFNYQQKVLVRRRLYEGSLAADVIKGLEGQLRVLDKTAQREDLTTSERQTLEVARALCRSATDRIRGKRHLLAGDFTSAMTSFQRANEYSPSLKTRLVLILLKIAPSLLQRLHRAREARYALAQRGQQLADQ